MRTFKILGWVKIDPYPGKTCHLAHILGKHNTYWHTANGITEEMCVKSVSFSGAHTYKQKHQTSLLVKTQLPILTKELITE